MIANSLMPPLTGLSSSHYKLKIERPRNLPEPYTCECEDIISALNMNFAEGNAFKAVWRKAAARIGNGKPGSTQLYEAEKVKYYGETMLLNESNRVVK